MRVEVDRPRCEGHGQCEERASKAFELNNDGNLSAKYENADVPADEAEDVEAAVAACPVAALGIRR